jgi:hypothetical protein
MPIGLKLVDGISGNCRRKDHHHCVSGQCQCQCHSDPTIEHYSKRSPASEAAKRAWQTRRGPGRPPTRAPAEIEPKRPDLRSGAKPPVTAAAARQIKSEFAFGLWLADQGAARASDNGLPHKGWWLTPDDRLQEDERTSLVNATYNELAARCPQVLVWLAKASESATEAALLYAIALVAAPRLARHGVIPNELASAIVFAPILFANAHAEQEQAADVGAGPTLEPDRANGYGEIDIGGVPVGVPQVQGGAQVETGQSDVPNGPNNPHRGGNGQHPL